MALIKCPKCGNEIEDNITVCPDCGSEINPPETDIVSEPEVYSVINTDETKYKNKKYNGIVLCVVACIMLIMAFTKVNNDTYSFYKQHYKECMDGYKDTKSTANQYVSGLFKSSYEGLASTYEAMAKADNEKIWEYRIQAIILCFGGVVCGFIGYKFIKRGKANSISKTDGRDYIQVRYETEQQAKCNLNTTARKNKTNINATFVIIVLCIVIFCMYYFPTRCAYDGCTKKREDSSRYCAYHSLKKSYSSSNYDYTPKTGNAGAEAKARSYLQSSAFSYTGLIKQLEYEGFSESEATYGADYCGADWEEQALRKAESYLNSSAFSYKGLRKQLEYEGFTEDEAQYGVDNCNADWKIQAAKKAKSYLNSSPNMSGGELMRQLQYEGFTSDEASYGVKQVGL